MEFDNPNNRMYMYTFGIVIYTLEHVRRVRDLNVSDRIRDFDDDSKTFT